MPFFSTLFRYLSLLSKSLDSPPQIGDVTVDLLTLFEEGMECYVVFLDGLNYRLVVKNGGLDHVNKEKLWPTVASNFEFPSDIVNPGSLLYIYYARYLSKLERAIQSATDSFITEVSLEKPIRKRRKVEYFEDSELDSFDLEDSEEEIPVKHRKQFNSIFPKGYVDNADAPPAVTLYTARPTILTGTWQLNSGLFLGNTQDYTRTPIPQYSFRLFGRNKEGLIVRQLERSLKSTNPYYYSTALSMLVSRSWDAYFSLTTYELIIDRLYTLFKKLKKRCRMYSQRESHDLLNMSDNGENDLYQLYKISAILRNFSFTPQNVEVLSSSYPCIKMITDLIQLKFLDTTPIKSDPVNIKEDNLSLSDCVDILFKKPPSDLHSIIDATQSHGIEALTNIAHKVRFLKTENHKVSSNRMNTFGDNTNFSKEGTLLSNSIPFLAELYFSSNSDVILYLLTELFGKFSTNPNTKDIWCEFTDEKLGMLFNMLIQYTLTDEYISEWAILTFKNIWYAVLTDEFAHLYIETYPDFISTLMTVIYTNFKQHISNFDDEGNTGKKEKSKELYIAKKSSDILLKLAQIDTMRPYLIVHEAVFIEMLLYKGKLTENVCEILQCLQ